MDMVMDMVMVMVMVTVMVMVVVMVVVVIVVVIVVVVVVVFVVFLTLVVLIDFLSLFQYYECQADLRVREQIQEFFNRDQTFDSLRSVPPFVVPAPSTNVCLNFEY
jgi:hypothetical protein